MSDITPETVPAEWLRAAWDADFAWWRSPDRERGGSWGAVPERQLRRALAAAAPLILAAAGKVVSEDDCRRIMQETIGSRLAEVEAAVRANERERLAAVMSPDQFRILAGWFDDDDAMKERLFRSGPPPQPGGPWPRSWEAPRHELQDDLRRFAELLEGGNG